MLNESALYVYIFWVDNVFSSLVASALCEVFPQYSFSRNFSLSGLAEMLAYDFLVVTSTFLQTLKYCKLFQPAARSFLEFAAGWTLVTSSKSKPQ